MKTETQWFNILETLHASPAGLPYRTLMFGPPGTGKSSWAVELFGREVCQVVTLSQGSTREDLLGQFLLEKGQTVWHDGPATKAIRLGHLLILDELGEHSPEVETTLQGLLNDRRILSITLPNGERIQADDNYRVIGTTNTNPKESLGAALYDRFDLKLFAGTPAPAILDGLGNMRQLVENYYKQFSAPPVKTEMTVRTVMAFNRLLPVFGEDLAIEIVFGSEASAEIKSVLASTVKA